MSDSHENAPRRAFVSHSTLDDKYVAELEAFLRALGIDDVFNDNSSIKPDKQFWPAIEKGIADRDTLVVVITAASMDSEWVKREVEYARGLSKNIIPLRTEDCSIPSYFDGHRVIEFRVSARMERRCDVSRIVTYAPAELIGREEETALLADSWRRVLRNERRRPHILTFVALGGEGKTSLVAKWAAELAHQDWPGCDAAFAWSFYSQGTREQMAASSDLFLKEALNFFGDNADKQFAASPAGAYEKGQRLARIVGQRRSLLILDGLEPLQYAPTSPAPGQLKDQGLAALLKGLASYSRGLCVVTTRYSLPDLRAFWQTTALEVTLLRLSRPAGVHLLQSFGVKGSLGRNISFLDDRERLNEFEKLVEDVKGHALTLNLLGTYLRDAHGGDIRKRVLVKLEEADPSHHAFRVMDAYVRWMAPGGLFAWLRRLFNPTERETQIEGKRALAMLRLLGLFDRPLTSDCLGALLQSPAIAGITKHLVKLTNTQRNHAFTRLSNARLVTVTRDASGALDMLDSHPLLREYFGHHLKMGRKDSWQAANTRLGEHLEQRPAIEFPKSAEALDLLFRAVEHFSHGGQVKRAFSLLKGRVMHEDAYFPTRHLGLHASVRGCCLVLLQPEVADALAASERAFLLQQSGYCGRAIGLLADAINNFKAAQVLFEDAQNTVAAGEAAGLLAVTQLYEGSLKDGLESAQLAVGLSKRQQNKAKEMYALSALGKLQLYSGDSGNARTSLRTTMELLRDPSFQKIPANCANIRYRYCELLIAEGEFDEAVKLAREGFALAENDNAGPTFIALLYTAASLAEMGKPRGNLTDVAQWLNRARVDFATGGMDIETVRGELAWAEYCGRCGLADECRLALDRAWEIAERGPMRLHMADIRLYRARLFFREQEYPWNKNLDGTPRDAKDDLAAAEKLINKCGYHRRDEELADAKAAIFGLNQNHAMPFLADSPLSAPILPSLASSTPPPARLRAGLAADAIDDLQIPPADGKVLRPGDAGFDDLLPFNLRTTSRPQVIAQCRTAHGVSVAVQWARQHDFPLVGHGGGHSYEGFSSGPGLMIDVRSMNAIVVDAASRTARIGAGCLLGDVAEALFAAGFALPTGTCQPVGIAGSTLGGGHGVASRKFGLTCDNLLSARLVDATGTELTVSTTENPDLYWALRGGGGGNFGIVTEFTFQVHPVNRVITFRIVWPTNYPTAVLKAWQNFAQSAPDEVGCVLVMSGSGGSITGIRCTGLYLPKNAGGTPRVSELEQLLDPLVSIGDATLTTKKRSYIEAARYFAGNGDPDRVYFKGKSDYSPGALSSDAIKAFLAALRSAASPVAVIFEAYGGAINRVAEADTAFPHRDARFCMQYYAEWSASAATTRNVASVRSVYAAMRPYLPGHSYVNYIDLDLLDSAPAYYRGNLPRLQAVKAQYDPDNFFHFAQSIPLPP